MPSDQRKRLSPPRGVTVKADDIMAALEALPPVNYRRRRTWTKEEDAALLKYWPVKNQHDVARTIGVHEHTARNRYRELTE